MSKGYLIFLITALVVVLAMITCCVVACNSSMQYTEHTYNLSEIQDGVYGVYSTVVSNVPADNYDIIILCCDGQVRTFKGGVVISYTDTVPYVVYRDVNCVNADIVYVYVPFGSIVYQGTTGIGSRR